MTDIEQEVDSAGQEWVTADGSADERSNSPKNIVLMLLMLAAAFVLNPLVKLKDWLKGERE